VVDERRGQGGHAELPLSSALVIPLDGSGGFDEVRRDHAVEAVALGIPFHVTLLYPFAPRGELTDELLSETGAFFAGRRPFEFELTHIATWPRVVYAVPEPDDELRDLMHALFARFPQWPPYGGIHDEVVPHATLGEEVDAAAVCDEIEHRVAPLLPRRCQARDVALLEEFEPERWRERERFPLGGQAKAGA
jgi:2'-5' RNA ligase